MATVERRSELRLRVLSGLAMAAAALLALWAGGSVFAVFWTVAACAVAAEWMAVSGVEPRRWLAISAGLGVAALAAAEKLGAGPAALAIVAAAVVFETFFVARRWRDWSWAVAGFFYAAAVALVPIALRDRPDAGLWAVLWMFAVVWTTDVAAFFVGHAVGGPKLWPRVSPKKTWSGFVGGLAGGAAAATAVAALAGRSGVALPAPLGVLALAAVAASAASQAGDLAESAMKRRFGVKDSGRLIPGHGGALDRLDGFAAVSLLVGAALLGERWAAQPAGAP